MDKVFINNLKIKCIIGLHHYERKTKQPIIIDLELAIDSKKSAINDDINDTIDYDDLSEWIIEVCSQKQFNLLETLAEYLSKNIIYKYKTDWLKLKITKPFAISATQDVGISIERNKHDYL